MGYGGWIYLSQRITQQLDISLTNRGEIKNDVAVEMIV